MEGKVETDDWTQVTHKFWYRWNRTYYKVMCVARIPVTPETDEFGIYDTDWDVKIYNTDYPLRSHIAQFELTTQYDERPTRQDVAYAWIENATSQSLNMLTEVYDTDPC